MLWPCDGTTDQDRAGMSERQLAARVPARDRPGRGARSATIKDEDEAGAEPAARPPLLTEDEIDALLAPARCCPSGPSWRRSRCATRACWSSARARWARRSRCTSAGAGVGRIGLADSDVVEVSNLHRQPLHFTPDTGVAKVESAAAKLRFLNPEVLVEPYQVRVDEDNAARAGRGPGPGDRLHATPSRPATPSTPPAARRASTCRGRRDRLERHGDDASARGGRACYRCAFPDRAAWTRRRAPRRACSARRRA